MSFESFRADMISRLAGNIPGEHLNTVLTVIDDMSSIWDFQQHNTSIIPTRGLPDAVRLYIASKSVESIARGTLENYLSTLKAFFTVMCRDINEVTTADIRLWLNWYKQTRNVKNVTLEQKRIVLNTFFSWCVDEDLLRKNPMKQIKPIRCEEPERLPLSPLELEKVRNACRTLREKALVDFLYSTAIRVSEFCALNISDIDFTEHTVRIVCGKGSKGRTTFLNPESEVSLKAYLDSRNDDCDALFIRLRGPAHRLEKKAIENEIKNIVSRCKLSVHVTPHIFRHTAATLALQRGMPIDQVQKFLGHSKVQTTLRYAKTLQADVKNNHSKYVA